MIGTTPAGTRASMSGWMITAPAEVLLKCCGVAPVVQEAYLVRARRLQRSNACQQQIGRGCRAACRSATVAIECGPLRVKKRASPIDISACPPSLEAQGNACLHAHDIPRCDAGMAN